MAFFSIASDRLDLAALAVLGILCEADHHPYEIARLLRDRHQDEPPGHTSRSLYHAVEKLVAGGLIAAVETIRDGRRPERTVYQVTEDGREEFHHTLFDILVNPGLGSRLFMSGVSRLGHLSEEEAVLALGMRLAALEGAIAQAKASSRVLMERTRLPRLFLLEGEYRLAQMEAEASWVGSAIESIRSGELDVSPEWLGLMAAESDGIEARTSTPLALLQHDRIDIPETVRPGTTRTSSVEPDPKTEDAPERSGRRRHP